MKITLLCSDINHPVNTYLQVWMETQREVHDIDLVQRKSQLTSGELLFLISCSDIITASDRAKYAACLVLHASDLPKGRGWSPHLWELIEGADFITLSLLEADDKVDCGRIWNKKKIQIPKHALWDEINHLLFSAEIELINYAVDAFTEITPSEQTNSALATYYPRRTPKDSELDVNKTIAQQFDLIRVCDPNRFPPHFDYLGQRYILKLEKSNEK